MTTATLETMTTDALLAEVQKTRIEFQKAITAMPDVLDLPGSLSERQMMHERDRRVRLPQHVGLLNTLSEQIAKAAAKRDALTPQRDRLREVLATITKEIEDAPDHRTIAVARESTHDWAHQNALRASIRALERGVEYFNGQPALPIPLRELLTDVCASCGHATVNWAGPLPELEGKIEKAERPPRSRRFARASRRGSTKRFPVSGRELSESLGVRRRSETCFGLSSAGGGFIASAHAVHRSATCHSSRGARLETTDRRGAHGLNRAGQAPTNLIEAGCSQQRERVVNQTVNRSPQPLSAGDGRSGDGAPPL